MKTKALSGILLALSTTIIAHAGDWKLVWKDEFDKPGLPDSTKWEYEFGFLGKNHEKQFVHARSPGKCSR